MQRTKIMLAKPNFSENSIMVKQRNMLNYSFLIRLFSSGNNCLLQPKKNRYYMQENKTTTTTKGKTSFSP